MSAKLFVIELVHFTIPCFNSTWATRPFLIWLNYSCLGCSVSRRKTRLSIIWPCHSFISYAILQLILTPSLYLLIYSISLYFGGDGRPYHGYTFPNALTSFTVEERSKDHFTVVTLSLVVFLTSDETACQSANCHQPSL